MKPHALILALAITLVPGVHPAPRSFNVPDSNNGGDDPLKFLLSPLGGLGGGNSGGSSSQGGSGSVHDITQQILANSQQNHGQSHPKPSPPSRPTHNPQPTYNTQNTHDLFSHPAFNNPSGSGNGGNNVPSGQASPNQLHFSTPSGGFSGQEQTSTPGFNQIKTNHGIFSFPNDQQPGYPAPNPYSPPQPHVTQQGYPAPNPYSPPQPHVPQQGYPAPNPYSLPQPHVPQQPGYPGTNPHHVPQQPGYLNQNLNPYGHPQQPQYNIQSPNPLQAQDNVGSFCRFAVQPTISNQITCAALNRPECEWDPHQIDNGRVGVCICERGLKECNDPKCHWSADPANPAKGECISSAERFYGLLQDMLMRRGKKDFAFRINYEASPPYGHYGYGQSNLGYSAGVNYQEEDRHPGNLYAYGPHSGSFGAHGYGGGHGGYGNQGYGGYGNQGYGNSHGSYGNQGYGNSYGSYGNQGYGNSHGSYGGGSHGNYGNQRYGASRGSYGQQNYGASYGSQGGYGGSKYGAGQ
eukprot:maker-scaffold464_size163657-snap-gene-0.28 protein:Tk05267 transcript:maker-scaffold464_size163657-snap-gene-0.28-mRNA-1 annotation:"hypothetical protein EPUS_02985"